VVSNASGSDRGLTGADALAAALSHRYAGRDGAELLQPIITEHFPGRIALVSSFGTESALLLAMAAEIDPALPVLFLDTGKHFGATLRYRDQLIARLGLGNVRSLKPEPEAIAALDPQGMLWRDDPDACCHARKVLPLQRGLARYDAWVTGRKRYQGGLRGELPIIEADDGRLKINPLATWDRDRIEAELARRGMPRHPLENDGFLSIGCMPCTARATEADRRAGRWAGTGKTECGIHRPAAVTAAPA